MITTNVLLAVLISVWYALIIPHALFAHLDSSVNDVKMIAQRIGYTAANSFGSARQGFMVMTVKTNALTTVYHVSMHLHATVV